MRLSSDRSRRPLQGFGITVGIDSSSIANAVLNVVEDRLPGLIDTAMVSIRPQIPGIVQENLPGAIDSAWPKIQSKAPGLVPILMPEIANQVPRLVQLAVPAIKTQMPQIRAAVMPVVKAELDGLIDTYAQRYLGPAARFKEFYPVVATVVGLISLFASGIVIYQFWSGER